MEVKYHKGDKILISQKQSIEIRTLIDDSEEINVHCFEVILSTKNDNTLFKYLFTLLESFEYNGFATARQLLESNFNSAEVENAFNDLKKEDKIISLYTGPKDTANSDPFKVLRKITPEVFDDLARENIAKRLRNEI